MPAPLDVTDAKAVADFVPSLPEEWRRIDVLVNNAGLALGLSPAWEASLDDWDRMIATDITGLVHMTRAILPQMVERNDGLVINLGSVAGDYSYPGGNVYGGAKAFVLQFSLNLRSDLAGQECARHQYRAGHGDGFGIQPGAVRRRRGQGGGGLCRYAIADP